jgi:hypothetical protein
MNLIEDQDWSWQDSRFLKPWDPIRSVAEKFMVQGNETCSSVKIAMKYKDKIK